MLLIKTENVERGKRNKRFLLCSTLFCKPEHIFQTLNSNLVEYQSQND